MTDQLVTLLESLRRSHDIIDDCWYSCPKSGGCCNSTVAEDTCNCGADAHNARLDEAIAISRASASREVSEGLGVELRRIRHTLAENAYGIPGVSEAEAHLHGAIRHALLALDAALADFVASGGTT